MLAHHVVGDCSVQTTAAAGILFTRQAFANTAMWSGLEMEMEMVEMERKIGNGNCPSRPFPVGNGFKNLESFF